MLTATKKGTVVNKEDDAALLSAVNTTNMLSQLRADSEYDEDDDHLLASRPASTDSPPPIMGTKTANSTGMIKLILIFK